MLLFHVIVFVSVGWVLPFGASEEEKPDCDESHPVAIVGCNHCNCKAGHLINCSRFRCREIEENPNLSVVCIENEFKQEDCNLCICKSEKWDCTYIPCESTKRRRSVIELGEPCLDGITTQYNCKECVCKDEKWDCIENSCVTKRHAEDLFFADDLKHVPCAPRSKFEIDCHICKCNENSRGYNCDEETEICNEPTSPAFLRNAFKYLDLKQKASDIELPNPEDDEFTGELNPFNVS